MSYENAEILVIGPDRAVIINGVNYKCLVTPPPFHAMRWTPGKAGYVEALKVKDGTETGEFKDFAFIKPFIAPWEEAQKAADAVIAAKSAAAKAAAEQEAAEEAKWAARRADRAQLNEALTTLGTTDHEVIKAMEAVLAEQGKLPADLVATREAARATAKAEKARLK
jgi:hypothetical protein